MFISLSKKILCQTDTLHYVSWSKTLGESGDIAIAGDGDFLKVLNIDTSTDPSSVVINERLAGHSGDVIGAIWNDEYKKLTTFDRNGLIIDWILSEEDTWEEEMIYNRRISVLKSIVWEKSGKNVCIVYEDGYVIVRDEKGNRIWAEELRIARINCVEWSPDGKLILLGLINGEIHIYDGFGNYLYQAEVPHLRCIYGSNMIACMQWFNGLQSFDFSAPTLAVCLKYGRCQIMRDRLDENSTFIDTKMMIAQMAWNHDGSILAFAGSQKRKGETKRFSVIEFYEPYGSHLRTLDVPWNNLTSCSWGPNSQYLAVASDSYLYLASNKPDHKWGYCSTGNTLVYAFKPVSYKEEHCVVFFEVSRGEKYVNYVKKIISFATSSDYCCLASKVDDKYVLALCDSIGTPIDSKFIKLKPVFLTVTKTHVIAASRKAFYAWQFKSIPFFPGDTSGRRHKCFERLTYIADNPGEACSSRIFDDDGDKICSICASDKLLIVGCVSGTFNIYEMPMVKFSKKHCLNYSAQQLSLNSSSSRLSIIDFCGNLTIFGLEHPAIVAGMRVIGNLLDFKKSDVWHVRWAEDLHGRFVVMDKTKMHIFVECNEVDSSSSNGYVCKFSGDRVMTASMNDIMDDPKNPEIDHVKNETIYPLV